MGDACPISGRGIELHTAGVIAPEAKRMDLQKHVVEAIVEELDRQASNEKRHLKVDSGRLPEIVINGPVDAEKLAMAIAGALAGGP
jgi:hypothetical protein